MRVLVFGDSITQGFWDSEGGWVGRLRKHFDGRQIADLEGSDEPIIFNLGISADNSKNVRDRIGAEVKVRTRPTHAVKPAVIVQIGVNDSSIYKAKPQVNIKQYEQNLKKIYEKAHLLTSRVIFVGLSACDESKTAPVFWGDYHYANRAIKIYEDCMKKVANSLGIEFIPVHDRFKTPLDNGERLLSDGLHPNDAGHELVYQIVKPKLENLLISK